MKRRKSLLFISVAVVCSLPLGSKANFSGFVDQLRESNIPIDKILTQTGVTRYELTRLLNAVECKDCINPDESYLKVYTAQYWKTFSQTPGKDFSDISYADAMFNKKDYFYCVAYVGDNGYMRGYPVTSPVCSGKFCGTRNVTNAEFLQVVMNMIGKYIYSTYSLNWGEVKKWIADLDTDEYKYKTFSSEDIGVINTKAKTCKDQACTLENTNQLNIYLKYCMFNLDTCNMVSFDKIKEGYWPVAELNVLSKQQIVSIDEAASYNINEYIAGNLLIKIFSNMSSIIGCTFNNDYDCDGIINSQDSCPNIYSPHQTDTDKDGIGDVCDDDIDGDSSKNPIGIVDDNGNIVVELWTKDMDNCLFIVNKDQQKTSNNISLGDACTNSQNLSLAIAIPNISGDLPQTVKFESVHKAKFASYTWDFGDGSFANGENVSHTYTKSGIYSIRLIAKTDAGTQSLARTTVVVGHMFSEKVAIQPLIQTTAIETNASADLNLSAIGNFDYFEWSFSDGTIIQSKTTKLSKIFRNSGNIGVLVKGFKNNEIIAITTFTLGIGNSKGAVLKASVLNPDKETSVSFSTNTAGFFSKDINNVSWDFGDGNILQTQNLNISHVYKKSGQKVIIQTISLANGLTLKNMLTIYVVRPYLFDSYNISFLPNMNASSLSPLAFTTIINGSFSSALSFRTIFGDGLSQTFGTKNIRSPFVIQHRYANGNIYYPQISLMLDACINLSAQATLDVGGNDFCLDAKLNGTLNKLGCDIDKDGIPDICDTDIDGDGKPNLLGIITDPKQCDYIPQIKNTGLGQYNADGSINYDILNKHFQGVCSLDNDPFQKNDQMDSNNNNIGDSLDNMIINNTSSGSNTILDSFLDSDNDGIPDNQDLCPLLGELYNGIQDTDGCPEIGTELNCEDARLPIINEVQYICGNGIIEPGENCSNCPADVGICSPNCGNKIIDKGETCQTCPSDVGTCTSQCGDGIADPGETCNNCPTDVGACNPNCGNGKIDQSETCQTCPADVGTCISICGNETQEVGETCNNCPSDVKSCTPNCGNGIQETGETCNNCPTDAKKYCDPDCGNKTIDQGETCQTCPVDVQACFSQCGNGKIETNLGEQCDNGLVNNGKDGKCSSICSLINIDGGCGNGIIDPGETCQNCPTDVKSCDQKCGNGKIDPGETCQTCPVDVQACFSNCGNGKIETNLGEQCDNGLINNGKDGKCGIRCTLVNTCGNGVQDAGEDCFTCPQDTKGCLVIVAKECLQCPCPFADFSAGLTNGDQIKAVLWDKTKKYPWSYSVAYEIGY